MPLYPRNKWSNRMNHISLLANFFLLSTQPSPAMEVTNKNNNEPSYAIAMCLSGIADGDLERVKRGLEKGADVNYIDDKGSSLFSLACSKEKMTNIDSIRKSTPIVRLLVSQKNIDPFARTFNDTTPLHAACQFGITETIKEIIKKAPHLIHARTKQGHTPFYAASFFQQVEAMQLLLAQDKKIINVQDYEGDTAFMLHVEHKHST